MQNPDIHFLFFQLVITQGKQPIFYQIHPSGLIEIFLFKKINLIHIHLASN